MMREWRSWALTGRFDIDGYPGRAADVAAFDGQVLSIGFERDHFSTRAAVDRALSPFTGAVVTRRVLGRKEQGDNLGHTGWARAPAGAVEAIIAWLATGTVS